MQVRNSLIIIIFLLCIIIPNLYGIENSTKLYKEGSDAYRKGNLKIAEEKFRSSIVLNKDYCLAHYGLGRVYLKRNGKNKDSIRHLKLSVKLDPSYSKGFFYLGLSQMFAGLHVPALHSFQKAYSMNPALVESLYNTGVIFEHLGRNYQAFKYYRLYYNSLEGKRNSPF